MKKLLFMFAGLALLFTACNMAIPESVSVKTDADYNFSIGDIKKDLNDTFKVSELFAGLDNDYTKIYDYFPEQKNEKLQQFVLTVNIASIDLQLGDYDFSPLKDKSLAQALTLLGLSSTLNFDNEDNPTEIDMDIGSIFDSFDVLGEEFKQKVNFADLAVYMYFNVSSGVEAGDSPLKSSIKIENADKPTINQWLIGESKTKKAAMKFASIPELKTIKIKDEDVVINDISAEPSSVKDLGNMTSFINKSRNNSGAQKLTYYVDIDTAQLVCTGDPITTLDIKMCLVLPLKFAVTSTDESALCIDLKTLSKGTTGKSESEQTDKEKDIFGRDKATDISDIEKYLDVIEKVEISYKTKKNPFVADSSKYIIDSQIPPISEEADVNQDTVKVTGEQLKGMLEKYPYEPKVAVEIANKSTVALPRDIALDMNMALMISTNGNTIKF